MKSVIHATLAAFVLLSGGIAQATTITFEFSGTVISFSEDNNSFGGLNVGDSFLAKFVFDTNSPDLLPADSANGRYSAISASLEVPHLNVVQPGGTLDVSNGTEFDRLIFDSTGVDFQIRAVFSGGPTAMASDAMPTESFPLMDGTHVLNVYAMSGSDKFAGTITSAVIIPEPSVLALMLVYLLSMRPRHG